MMRTGILTALVAIASQAGCAAGPPVRIATDATFPPFHYVDERGEVTGFDVELARAVVRRANRRAVVVRVETYGELFESLEQGTVDMIAATTGITAARQERYAFTSPYFETCLAAVVRRGAGEPDALASLAGRRVAATAGTTSVGAAASIAGAEVVETASGRDGLAMLRAGEVDAIIHDEFEAVQLARDDAALRVLAKPAAIERYGFVLREDATELRDRLDRALRDLERAGTGARIRDRFGLDRPPDWPLRPATPPDTMSAGTGRLQGARPRPTASGPLSAGR